MKRPSYCGATTVLGRIPRRVRSFGGGRAVLLAAVIVMGAVGCYRPSLKDGGLVCATTSPMCPEGYTCRENHCYSGIADAGLDVADAPSDRADTGGADGHLDGSPMDGSSKDMDGPAPADADATTCVARQALAGCTPQQDLACDPVCQTGCCTSEKCTAMNQGADGSTTAVLGCSPGSWQRKEGETCDVTNAGTQQRKDNCLPGLLCVAGDAEKICMKLCRGDGDCTGGAACESRQIERPGDYLASVCGLPSVDCNPSSTSVTATGCPPGRTCYLLRSSAGDRTVCDISSGGGGNGASCTFPSDCFPGWTCPTAGPGAGRCHPVCDHDAASSISICPIGLTCQTTGTASFDLCL